MLWNSKQQAIERMSLEKKGPDACQKSVQELFLMLFPLSNMNADLEAFLFRSEQGDLTSCLELSNVFEISQYSIPENSTWNGPGIILFCSPRHCPYSAVIFGCDSLQLSQTDNCLNDAGMRPAPYRSSRLWNWWAAIIHPSYSRWRKCMQFGT